MILLDFINQYHKRQLDVLKASLEQENWQRAEISADLISSFSVFFGKKLQDGANEPSQVKSDDEGNPQEQNLTKDATAPSEVAIQNNEVHMKGNKYQITSSFILLLQNINDYVEIASQFKYIGLDAISKLFEMVKSYNSYSLQLVLEAGAISFGKIPRITAKVLGNFFFFATHSLLKIIGLSSISLCLLADLIDPLHQTLLQLDLKLNQDWLNLEVAKVKHDLNNHINEIGAKVRSILKSK